MDNTEKLREAYRIFADAILYPDHTLLHYLDLITDIFGSTKEISCYFGSMEKYNVPIEDRFFLISCINWAISKLSLEDAKLINMYYGLNGYEPTSLEKISENTNVHYGIIVKSHANALRHLTSPSKIIKSIIPFIREENEERIISGNYLSSSLNLSLETFFRDSPLPGGINVRCYNALRRKGIKTIQQLIDFPEDELPKIRNLGSKSIEFILQKKKELATL